MFVMLNDVRLGLHVAHNTATRLSAMGVIVRPAFYARVCVPAGRVCLVANVACLVWQG